MKSGKLRSETRRVVAVDDTMRDAMFALFERYYVDVSRSTFDADLARKTHVILLFDSGDGTLQGFSNVEVYRHAHGDRRVQVVFSGDTVIDRAYWGQGVAQRAYAALFVALRLRRPFEPLYYFLLSKGYKTYLLLTRSYSEHWPRHDRPTPPDVQALLDALAREKFGALYDPTSGLLRMGKPDGRLREDVAPITPRLLEDPEIRFFAERNPGHTQADELCCLAAVPFTMPVRYVASRTLRKARARGVRRAAESTG
jgi:hypothetical protein